MKKTFGLLQGQDFRFPHAKPHVMPSTSNLHDTLAPLITMLIPYYSRRSGNKSQAAPTNNRRLRTSLANHDIRMTHKGIICTCVGLSQTLDISSVQVLEGASLPSASSCLCHRTTSQYASLPPKMSRALPMVKSTRPFPSVRTWARAKYFVFNLVRGTYCCNEKQQLVTMHQIQ